MHNCNKTIPYVFHWTMIPSLKTAHFIIGSIGLAQVLIITLHCEALVNIYY